MIPISVNLMKNLLPLFFNQMSTNAAKKSLDTLFRQHHKELKNFAQSRLRCPEDAADVVQDTFVRYAVMEKKRQKTNEKVPTIDTPRFFLSRIVTNIIIDRMRTKKRRGIHMSLNDIGTDGTEIGADIVDLQPSLYQIVAGRQQLKILTQALDDLPTDCRDTLLLNRIEGYTHKQIAQQLGISQSMVSKHIMQAIKHCAKRLSVFTMD